MPRVNRKGLPWTGMNKNSDSMGIDQLLSVIPVSKNHVFFLTICRFLAIKNFSVYFQKYNLGQVPTVLTFQLLIVVPFSGDLVRLSPGKRYSQLYTPFYPSTLATTEYFIRKEHSISVSANTVRRHTLLYRIIR